MKKIFFSLAILCSIFFMVNVSAEENTISIESLTIEDKSNNVVVNEKTILDGNTIKPNLSFKDKNDYIIYKLTLKNNSDKAYLIDSIIDDNQNEAFLYTYQFDDKEFKSNEEKVVYLTIKYNEILTDSELDENNTYHLESTNKITVRLKEIPNNVIIDIIDDIVNVDVNPSTIRNSIGFIVFILIGILIFNSFFVSKKKKKVLFFIIGILSITNICKASAEDDFIKVELTLTNKFDVHINFLENNWNSRILGNYTKINVIKGKETPDAAVDVSEKQDGSIKAWVDGDTVYIASNYKIYTPRNSDHLFNRESNVTEINFEEDSISSRFSTNLSYMFSGLSLLEELDTSWFDTLNVTNMRSMFYNCASLKELNLGSFDTSKVIDIDSIFANMDSLEEIIVPRVLPFANISFNLPFRFKDDLGVEYTSFTNTIVPNIKLNIVYKNAYLVFGKQFNEKVKKLAGDSSATFRSINTNIIAIKKASIRPDISKMTDDNIISDSKGEFVYAWFDNGVIYYYSDSKKPLLNSDCSYMFNNLRSLGVVEFDSLDFTNVTNMNHMFSYVGYDVSEFYFDLSKWNTKNVTDMSCMFSYAGFNVTTWNIEGLETWDTKNVTNMSYMFYYVGFNAEECNIKSLENWNTENVVDMSYMFCDAGYKATTLIIGDLANWDTKNVTNMGHMFTGAGYNATEWNIGDLANWDTSNVIDMSYMFSGAGMKAATWNIGDLANWKTSKVVNMSYMFYYAGFSAIEWSIGSLSDWDTSNVTNMSYMFCDTGYKTANWDIGNLLNWDTGNVENMDHMFTSAGYNATTWNVGNLSNWNTEKVTNMSSMFSGSGTKATTWNIGDLSNWNTEKVTNMSYMFATAGQKATNWGSIGSLKVYASNIQFMFSTCFPAKANLKIYSNPTSYNNAFNNAATKSGSGITVDYISSVTNIDNIIATKSSNSNVLKGNLITD